jgi:serine/threonine protein phosphatase 1
MISRPLFLRSSGPSGPRRHRAYAIGDVHGRLDLLESLLAAVEDDIQTHKRSKVSIVFLGDLIDRGPASAQVIERLRTYRPPNASAHFIMGNHEEVLLRALDGDAEVIDSWLRFGGAETLRSYGVEPRELKRLDGPETIARLRSAVPDSHRRFLRGFSDSISFGDYLFVHAGIRPGVDLSEQTHSDLRWIREPFLSDSSDHGFVVVHGHTIINRVEVTRNRIGIDTGAFCTGTLTALAIDGSDRWLFQTGEEGTRRVSLEEEIV